MKQKTTNLDVDELKLSKKRREPRRIEGFLSGKAAPEYASDVISYNCRRYFESLDRIIKAIEDQINLEDSRTYMRIKYLLL